MKYFVMFTLLAFMVVVCYMDVFKYIIRRDYWEGLRAVPIVMMAEILMGVYFNLSFWYKLTAKTYWGAIMSAVGCAVLVMVNVLLVPRIGYMACAWGGLAGYGTCVLLSYFIGQRHYHVPYPVWSILGWFAFALVLSPSFSLPPVPVCISTTSGSVWPTTRCSSPSSSPPFSGASAPSFAGWWASC